VRITPQSIQDAVAFIEDNLDRPISPSDVAAAVGASRFALHRLFRASVGESLQRYVLKRRLTRAAEALSATDQKILRLAMEAGFGSQEAFTRAFRAQFDVTPGRYRRDPSSRRRPGLARPSAAALDHRHRGVSHEPRIEVRGAELRLQGHGTAAGFDDDTPIVSAWDRVLDDLGARSLALYGTSQASHPEIELTDERCLAYVAAVEANLWPATARGAVEVVVPPGRYAVFEHRGPLERIIDTVNYAWASWLPRGEYRKSSRPDLEVLDTDQLAADEPRMELWVAVE
jgi:AraC family transcriptional regulator